MNQVELPSTGLSVSQISLGTVPFGSTLDRETSFRLLDRYVEAGGNFIDTAKVYADWLPGERSTSEKTVGAWLHRRGGSSGLVIATKGAHPDLAAMNVPRLSPAEITADLEASLRHLGLETVDLYWLHRDDPARPVGEILETLAGLARAGKIRACGCSNWKTERISAAQDYARANGLPPFAASQVMWNAAVIDPAGMADQTLAVMDAEMAAFHRQAGLPVLAYTSQAGGLFSKLAEGRGALRGGYRSPRNWERLARIRQIGAQAGLSITQVVLGYLLSQPFLTVPIIGPRSEAQLLDSLTAADVRLAPEQLAFLEAA